MKLFGKVLVAVLPCIVIGQNVTSGSNYTFTFKGPSQCETDKSVIGYSDMTVLGEDMYVQAYDVHVNDEKEEENYLYKLCPDTTFDMDSFDLSKTIMPLLNNTVVQCGNDGKSTDNCMLYSGQVQIILTIGAILNGIEFRGLTFTENYGVSVGAWAFPTSMVKFKDCHWHLNNAATAIEMYYEPAAAGYSRKLLANNMMSRGLRTKQRIESFQSRRRTQGYPSMTVHLEDCTFKSNTMRQSVILDGGGKLKIQKTAFVDNNVGVFTIGALFGSKLYLEEGTKFMNNDSPAFTVFVDNDSELELNDNTYGEGGVSQTCSNGIFLENDDAYCLYNGGVCHGMCCNFGNSSCDNFMTSEEMEAVKINQDIAFQGQASSAKNQATSSDGSGGCTGVCLIVAIVVPVVFALFSIGMFLFMRRRKRKAGAPELGNAPVTQIS